MVRGHSELSILLISIVALLLLVDINIKFMFLHLSSIICICTFASDFKFVMQHSGSSSTISNGRLNLDVTVLTSLIKAAP